MTTEQSTTRVGATAPQNITELFKLATENLKQKGQERPAPSASNIRASVELNRKLLDSIFLEQRLLDPVESDTSATLFGARLKMPVFCSALSRPGHLTDADMVEIARGMGKAGAMMMLGMSGSEVLKGSIATGTPVVKIIKAYRDLDLIYKQVKEVEQEGGVATGIDIDYWYGTFRDGGGRGAETYAPRLMKEIGQIMASTKLPYIIKGILSEHDAKKAIELGASAIIVSNHLWATFDFGIPNIVALPKIVKAVGNKITVFVDSGYRTGNDVFKAFALGAKGVGITSAVVHAVSAGGADGVARYLGFVQAELKRTMTFCGCRDLADINQSQLVLSPEVRQWW